MAKKTDWRQPSLFPPEPGSSPGQAPTKPTQPDENATLNTEGEGYAPVQNDRSRTPPTSTTDTRPASPGTEADDDDGVNNGVPSLDLGLGELIIM